MFAFELNVAVTIEIPAYVPDAVPAVAETAATFAGINALRYVVPATCVAAADDPAALTAETLHVYPLATVEVNPGIARLYVVVDTEAFTTVVPPAVAVTLYVTGNNDEAATEFHTSVKPVVAALPAVV